MPLGVGGAVPSVLLVEDDAPTRIFLSENLIADRFAPLSASSTEEAVRQLSRATGTPASSTIARGLSTDVSDPSESPTLRSVSSGRLRFPGHDVRANSAVLEARIDPSRLPVTRPQADGGTPAGTREGLGLTEHVSELSPGFREPVASILRVATTGRTVHFVGLNPRSPARSAARVIRRQLGRPVERGSIYSLPRAVSALSSARSGCSLVAT
jgi:hypothetical protein